MQVVWGVRCFIEEEVTFFNKSVVALGWGKIGDLGKLPKNRRAYKDAFAKVWPDASKLSGAVQAGQLYRFVCEAKVGDYVIFPSKSNRTINIGKILSEYFHDPTAGKLVQQRKVEWLKKDLPRTAFSQGALYEIGSAMTFFQVRNYADEFLAAFDDSFKATTLEVDDTIDETVDEIKSQTRDYVLRELKKHCKGYDFELVVQDVLRAMGYSRSKVSAHGGDHGKDIIVYKDELPPRIVVQVKSQDANITEDLIQQLKGCMEEGDYGLFVALSDFKENAKKFLERNPRIRGIDKEEFINLFLKYYDQLNDDIRREIPMQRVYIANPEVGPLNQVEK